MTLLDFARTHLFSPLGITEVDWVAGADGVYSAASGLRLRPRDLARIGQLILQNGSWADREIVPADWLAQAFTPRIDCFDDVQYGYQWYLRESDDGNGKRMFAMGNGGQRLILLPKRQLVVAILCGQYNMPDQWQTPAAIMLQHILPGLTPPT
jgi:CubicO group peptidase (beta-lactamase class C family)